MDLPTYTANIPHHRASLLCNLKTLRERQRKLAKYYPEAATHHGNEMLKSYIRRDLTSLNGMQGEW